jgi:PhzF family phenazine biosynthesis protein
MAKTFAFKKIDAFATRDSAGNPAAAIYLDVEQDISAHEMQRIAQELAGFVGEVGYVRRVDDATFDLRYYSAERAVEFCGHATIAIMYDLLGSDAGLAARESLTIVTDRGELVVENRIAQEDAVYISAPSPRFSSKKVTPERLAEALGISQGAISTAYSMSIVNAGLETLLVPMDTLQAVLDLAPPFEALKRFCQQQEIDIVTLFTGEVADGANAYRTRVFCPTFGYLEDPATGSGNSALGYYLLENDRWDGQPISLEQNGDCARPNIVKLASRQDEGGEVRVVFGGGAIVRIVGEYVLA